MEFQVHYMVSSFSTQRKERITFFDFKKCIKKKKKIDDHIDI